MIAFAENNSSNIAPETNKTFLGRNGDDGSAAAGSNDLSNNLQRAYARHDGGDASGAVRYMRRVVRAAANLYGRDNSMTLTFEGALGSLESRAGRDNKAITRLRDVLSRANESLADNDHLIADLELRLSGAYERAGRHRQALELSESVQRRYRRAGMGPKPLGDAEWATALALAGIAGRAKDARVLALSAYAKLENAFRSMRFEKSMSGSRSRPSRRTAPLAVDFFCDFGVGLSSPS